MIQGPGTHCLARELAVACPCISPLCSRPRFALHRGFKYPYDRGLLPYSIVSHSPRAFILTPTLSLTFSQLLRQPLLHSACENTPPHGLSAHHHHWACLNNAFLTLFIAFASRLRIKLSTLTKPRDPAIKAAAVQYFHHDTSRNHCASPARLHPAYLLFRLVRGLYPLKSLSSSCRKPHLPMLLTSFRAVIEDWNVGFGCGSCFRALALPSQGGCA
jgi:hypothetical protein